MKQLAILMAFLLAVLLLVTGVMAVGNARQAEQMTEKARQLSSTKAELRKANKQVKQLTAQLDSSRDRVRGLLLEQKAVGQRVDGLWAQAQAGMAALTMPVEAAGVSLLKAGALEAGALETAAAVGEEEDTAGTDESAGTGEGRICWAADDGAGDGAADVAAVSGEASDAGAGDGVADGDAAGGGVAAAVSGGASDAGAVDGDEQASEAAAVLAVSDAVQLPVMEKEESCDPAGHIRELLRPYIQRLEEALEEVQELLRVFLQDEA